MDGAGRRAERVRSEAIGFARDARRAARRHRRRIGDAREKLDAAAAEVELAAGSDDAERLSGALQRLDGLWDEHLSFTRRGLARRLAVPLALAAVAAFAFRACVAETLEIPTGSMVPTLLAGDRVLVWKPAYGWRLPFVGIRPFGGDLPRRGEVVVLAGPKGVQQDWVKRVVGLPGDVVELREQVLWVNGVPQPREAAGELAYEELNEETGVWWTDTCRVQRERLAEGPLARPASAMPVDVEASWSAAEAKGVRVHDALQCRRVRPGAQEGPFEVVRPGHVFVLGDNRDRSADSRQGGGWQVPFARIKGRVVAVAWSRGRGGGPGDSRGLRFERLFKVVE
ncbi:MAG TPA: signal peptidase I [Anaeromyxobacteraceae bacterium]|nr:signal peptidase I [Anaeromyxobacteraceae bacterium]